LPATIGSPASIEGREVVSVAHFTAAELPGTVAVLVFGIVIGVAVANRRPDALTLAVLGFTGLAAVGSLLDHFSGVPAAWATWADAAFLVSALVLLFISWAGRAPSRRLASLKWSTTRTTSRADERRG
jgi:hypothetical protein